MKHKKLGSYILFILVLSLAAYLAFHWFSSVDGTDSTGLTKQASTYLDSPSLSITQTMQDGDFLAALCTDDSGKQSLCVFDRDPIFKNRWHANGGTQSGEVGTLHSWNFGNPQGDTVLIFFGSALPEAADWYTFKNNKTIYTQPITDHTVLDLFIIPENTDISTVPTLLNKDKQVLQ